jgi:ribonuclease HI
VRASGHVALEWSHPSPTADNCTPEERRFRNFEGFEIVNEFLSSMDRRPIAWDNLPPCMAMADGSCPANGKPGARASFAVVFACDQLGSPIIRGEVRPCVYEFVDTSVPEMGLRVTGTPATPSNNRGELMGIIAAMIAMLRWRALGRCQIVSDSQISIRTLLEWLPDRIRKRKEHELKNLDLVMIAWRLLGELRGRAASVELIHTRGHQGPPPAGATNRERLIHRGNELADTHAGAVISAGPPTYAVEVLNCAPALRRRLFVCE